jgi:WD40 repeat protein
MKCCRSLLLFAISHGLCWIGAAGACGADSPASDARPLARLEGAGGTMAAFSSDGRKILTCGGKQARVWNTGDYRPICEPLAHEQDVRTAALTGDARKVVTASGREARIWNCDSGASLLVLRHADQVFDAAFSPDGRTVATACVDRSARVWDAVTGELQFELKETNPSRTVTFSPDGKMLLVGTFVPAAMPNRGNAFESPNDSRIAGEIHAWSIAPRRDIWSEECCGRPVFSPDGKRVGVPANRARICDAATGARLAVWSFTTGIHGISMMAFARDGKRCLAAGDDGSDAVDVAARVFDIVPGKAAAGLALELKQVRGFVPNCDLASAAISPDGKTVALVHMWDGGYEATGVWDVDSGDRLLKLKSEDSRLHHRPVQPVVAFSADGKSVAFGWMGAQTSFDNKANFTTIWRVRN